MKTMIVILAGLVCFNALAGKKTKPVTGPAEQSILLINQNEGQVIVENNADTIHSMASITKLMTAMVVLDQSPDLAKKITLKSPYLGKKAYTVNELLDLALIRSDNHAAEVLSKNFYSNRKSFIEAMNYKALTLGMLSARFVDPTGLGADNSATAKDIAKMVFASGQYPDIRRSVQKTVEVTSRQGSKTRTVSISNTNKDILAEFDNILVSKTGTTTRAGKCLALLVEKAGQVYAIVILGEPNKIKRDHQARTLIYNYLPI